MIYMVAENNKDLEAQKILASKNIRLVILLALVAVSIYVGYIVAFYFKS